MSQNKVTTALQKIANNPEALAIIQSKMTPHNPWTLVKRSCPNAKKLIDGAI